MKAARSTSGTAILDWIERLGNRLPDPVTLFIVGTLLIMVLSDVGVRAGWSVEMVRIQSTGNGAFSLEPTGEHLQPQSLLSSAGLYWVLSSMVRNFVEFPPLGIVLTGMLGVGVAERTGLLQGLLKALMLITPRRLLTPVVIFLGVGSSIGSDAGYIVLPPLAAVLFIAAGRSPLAGIAAAFAGISGGFSASLLLSASDAVMAGFTTTAAHILDPTYNVAATCNWTFMIASTFMITLVGWAVSEWFVEPRLSSRPINAEGGPAFSTELTPVEIRGLWCAMGVMAALIGLLLAAALIPGGPLHGEAELGPGRRGERWVQVIVPMILLVFLLPALAYGWVARTVTSEKQVAKLMVDSISAMAPVIVLAFFAAQFIRGFEYSNLGRMLAMVGGRTLAELSMPTAALLAAMVVLTMVMNVLISSMSAKYAIMSPIFVPMLMMVGISPELTQLAYRIGDSVTNTITPMNAYMVIILALVQRYDTRAGMGTLLSMMIPYALVFGVLWTGMLIAWYEFGIPLGPKGPLTYTAPVVP